ncbi:MAG TPA: hypothetical protein VFA26_05380 [Gemmataceae bacterium]|nr:hypothetical protein [Gemmataceae bacterium]
MASFTDEKSRTWQVPINVGAVRRVRDRLGINLYALIEDRAKGLGQLLGDPLRLMEVVGVLCEEQIARAGISREDFEAGLAGDALEAATEAFVQGLVDFFPNPKVRETLRRVVAKAKRLANEWLNETVAKTGPALDQLTLEDVRPALESGSGWSGGSPASARSTPPP